MRPGRPAALARAAAGSSLLVVALLAAPLAGCSGGGGDGPATTEPTSTTEVAQAATTTTTPEQALAAGACPEPAEAAEPDPDRPRYEATAEVDLAAGTVEGTVEVAFTPDLDVDRVVFRLWPNGPRYAAEGVELEVGGDLGEVVAAGDHEVAEPVRPDPTTLEVPVQGGLAAGERIVLTLPYRLAVPGSVPDRVSRSDGAMRLGTFLPLLAWEPGVGWADDPPVEGFAEAVTSPTADVEVAFTVLGDDGAEVLATGEPDASGRRFTATAVRDFGASIGRFATATADVDLPDPVTVTVGVEDSVAEAPEDYLARVVESLRYVAFRYGAYPWPTFSLAVTAGLRGGVELPTHVMQGPDTGGRTTSHEVAHQWFYGLVGNDQGRDPVLDEGVASYAEARFEQTLDLWRARTFPPDVRGRAGEPMTFWDERFASYYPGVYVQGAVALASLGPEALVDCALRHHVARHRYGIATQADLVESMELVFPDAAEVLATHGIGG